MSINKRRVKHALVVSQQLTMIRIYGTAYAANGTLDQLTLKDLKRQIRSGVLKRVTLDPVRGLRYKENALRAMDICKLGRESIWYFARNSIKHAGVNKRGIKHYLLKFARCGSRAAFVALQDTYKSQYARISENLN